jgi:hypothetical protein
MLSLFSFFLGYLRASTSGGVIYLVALDLKPATLNLRFALLHFYYCTKSDSKVHVLCAVHVNRYYTAQYTVI